MFRTVLFTACITLTACTVHDPNDAVGRVTREFEQGEKLMNSCKQENKKCSNWYQFKKEWEAEIGNYTTFEVALARHKARVANGLDF